MYLLKMHNCGMTDIHLFCFGQPQATSDHAALWFAQLWYCENIGN